jgi:hypothetical protein
MGSMEELEGRVTALDAHTRLLEAVRETQVEDHQRIARLEGRFDGLEHGQAMILDLLRRRNGEEPPAAAE